MKKSIVFLFTVVVLGLIFLLVKPSHAGWIIKMKTKSAYETDRSVIYVQNNQIRVVDDEQTIIFNANNGEICFIDVHGKRYWKGNMKEFKSSFSGFQEKMMKEASAQMQKQMENMTAEQRAMMEEAMKNMQGGKTLGMAQVEPKSWDVQISRTHEMGNIAGYPARKYLVKVDGEVKEEVWLAENLIDKKDLDPEQFKELFESLNMDLALSYESTEEYAAFERKGFPLKTITFDMDFQQEEIAEEVIEKNIPRHMFLPPGGYTEVSLSELLMEMNKE